MDWLAKYDIVWLKFLKIDMVGLQVYVFYKIVYLEITWVRISISKHLGKRLGIWIGI